MSIIIITHKLGVFSILKWRCEPSIVYEIIPVTLALLFRICVFYNINIRREWLTAVQNSAGLYEPKLTAAALLGGRRK